MEKIYLELGGIQKKMTKRRSSFDKMPNWLNVLLIVAVVGTLLVGASVFLNNIVQGNVEPRYEVFIPASVSLGVWIIIKFIGDVFIKADLPLIMLIVLLIAGFVVLALGMFSKGESDRSTFFHIAAALLGLALGIPFGEKLRKDDGNRDSRTTRTAKTGTGGAQ